MPPKLPFVKLNTYGSVTGNMKLTRVGGLIRDRNGNWIQGSPLNHGITSSTQAELWRVRHDLNMAWQLGLRFLKLEVTSIKVLHTYIF